MYSSQQKRQKYQGGGRQILFTESKMHKETPARLGTSDLRRVLSVKLPHKERTRGCVFGNICCEDCLFKGPVHYCRVKLSKVLPMEYIKPHAVWLCLSLNLMRPACLLSLPYKLASFQEYNFVDTSSCRNVCCFLLMCCHDVYSLSYVTQHGYGLSHICYSTLICCVTCRDVSKKIGFMFINMGLDYFSSNTIMTQDN